MRCRVCEQTGKSFILANEDRLCRICEYLFQLTVSSLSEHWADVIKNNKSVRMKNYYKSRGISRT